MFKKILSKIFKKNTESFSPLLTGEEKPPIVPENWVGEPLPENQGWAWSNPDNRGDCVRIYAADEPFVVVTKDSMIIGGDEKPTGERLDD